MRAKFIKILLGTSLFVIFVAGYFLWNFTQPVRIIGVHQRNSYSDILVKNFPVTDRGKINWWLSHKEKIEETYRIPTPAYNGSFSITFWDFGDGYKEEGKHDRLCFNDMHTSKNCIEKDAIFTVDESKNTGTIFTVYEGIYRLNKNGGVTKVNNEK